MRREIANQHQREGGSAVRLTRRGLQRQWYAAMRTGVAGTPSARHLVTTLRSPGIFKVRTRRA